MRLAGCCALLVVLLTIPLFASPVPYIHKPLVPMAKSPGSAAFVLTVHGVGFASGAVVTWNGSPRITNFVSSTKLTANILATDLLVAGTANVRVVNPGLGGGTSNVEYFQIVKPLKAVSFSQQTSLGPFASSGIAVGDFNGDGKMDIVVTDSHGISNGHDLLTIPGNGDGTFGAPAYSSIGFLYPFITADLHNDGKLDLAMLNNSTIALDVLLGVGDGTFTLKGEYPSVLGYGIVAGDFNGDGKLDLAVTAGGTLEVFLGNGDGSFQNPVAYTVGTGAIVTGDFNGDGKLDLVLASGIPRQLNILMGNGDGSFRAPVTYPLSTAAHALVAADFNGDGILDLAVGYNSADCPACNSNVVSILLGNGDGTFRTNVDYPADESSDVLVAGDFNGDGKLDLCVMGTSAPNDSVGSLLLGKGNGAFQAPLDFYSAGSAGEVGLATADFNGDGLLDLVFNGTLGQGISVAPGTAAPVAHLSRTKMVFPTQLVGTTSATMKTTLSNIGSAPLQSIYVTSTGDFGQTNNCPANLSPGSNCVINITFKPTAIGARTGSVTIADNNDNINGSQQQVSLSGTGTVVDLSPNKLTFPPQTVGTTSSPQTVTLTNHSLSAVGINGITITGTNNGDFAKTNTCGSVVQAGSSCTISVTFTPTMTGARTAAVSVNDTGGGSPHTAALSGTGQ